MMDVAKEELSWRAGKQHSNSHKKSKRTAYLRDLRDEEKKKIANLIVTIGKLEQERTTLNKKLKEQNELFHKKMVKIRKSTDSYATILSSMEKELSCLRGEKLKYEKLLREKTRVAIDKEVQTQILEPAETLIQKIQVREEKKSEKTENSGNSKTLNDEKFQDGELNETSVRNGSCQADLKKEPDDEQEEIEQLYPTKEVPKKDTSLIQVATQTQFISHDEEYENGETGDDDMENTEGSSLLDILKQLELSQEEISIRYQIDTSQDPRESWDMSAIIEDEKMVYENDIFEVLEKIDS